MGILDELIILVKESVEEARQQQRRRDAPPSAPRQAQRSPEEIEHMRRALAQRAAEVHQEVPQQQKRPAPKRPEPQQIKQVAPPNKLDGRLPIRRLLRQPLSLRDLVVLKEVLDKPLALRRR